MTEPRIVSPQEARQRLARMVIATPQTDTEAVLAKWIATEPDRTRAAVVKALRDNNWRNPQFGQVADAIENGADL